MGKRPWQLLTLFAVHILHDPIHPTPNTSEQPMTCKEVNEFLMAYLDAELPEEARRAFEEHLSDCSSCTRYLEQYRRTMQLGREACTPADTPAEHYVPSGLLDAIRKARIDAGIGTT